MRQKPGLGGLSVEVRPHGDPIASLGTCRVLVAID